jgi:hypothetical protein
LPHDLRVQQFVRFHVVLGRTADHQVNPSGYRADLIFQLAEDRYRVDNLYDALVSHYFVLKPPDVLGKTFDYQLIYEHSAFAAYQADATRSYRYVLLPDAINLSKFEESRRYREAVITLPGLHAPHGAPRPSGFPPQGSCGAPQW